MINAVESQLATGAEADRLLVEVLPATSAESSSTTLHSESTDLPSWLCGEKGIKCQSRGGLITGQVESVDLFRRAHSICRQRSDCRVNVTLDATSMTSWEHQTSELLGQGFSVKGLGNSLLSVTGYCGEPSRRHTYESAIDLATEGGVSEGVIVFRCAEDLNENAYQLQMRMYSVKETDASALGIDTKVRADFVVPTEPLHVALLAKLEALAKERKVESVAEPLMRIVGNQTIEFATGSEFQVLTPQFSESRILSAPSTTTWKHLGLHVKAKVTELKPGKLRVSYDLSYRDRANREGDVSVSNVQSDLICELGVPVMASVLELRGSGGDRISVPLLERLPIIGPLFGHRTRESLNTRLLLWFVVHADDREVTLQPLKL